MGGEHGITDCGTPAGKISGKFSNRCFLGKAVAVWLQLDDQGRVRLVEEYLREAGNFENVRGLVRARGGCSAIPSTP